MTDSHSNPASDSNPSPTPSNPVASTGTEDEPPVRKGTSKKFHKRSRTGCQKCRARRIKCDETKPVCRNCQRHDALACVYDRQNEDSPPKEISAAASTPNFNKIPAKAVEPGESRNRRKLELDLLHFYITETGPNTSFDPLPSRNGEHTSYELWVKAMPRMAFKSEAMLYSMHAVTCLHKTRTTGGSSPGIPAPSVVAAFKEHHQYYLERALNCHREDLVTLTNVGDQSGESADILLLTASLLRVIVLVTFSKRSLSPYTPPIEWMRLTSSYRQVWSIAWNLNGDSENSQVTQLALTTARFPPFDESDDSDDICRLWDLLQEPGSRDGFLDEEGNPSEWWPNVRSGYEATIRHIGGIIQSMKRREPLRIVGRHLVRYPMYADSNFINMVGDGRPRALVLVAHLFALFEQLKQFWYIETLAQREVRAIATILPPHWQPYMQWPLQIVEYGFPPEYMATP